jgi:hypothetical protein
MKKILLLAMLITVAFTTDAMAQTGTYTKCKTLNGSVIVVNGSTCPAGTIWIGPG